MKYMFCLLALLLCASPAMAVEFTLGLPDDGNAEPRWLRASEQLLLVVSREWGDVDATLQRYERAPGAEWQAVGEPVAVVLGKNGQGWGRGLHPDVSKPLDPVKCEGDGRSPSGAFLLPEAFAYSPEELSGAALQVLNADDTLFCVDDPQSSFYNEVVHLPRGQEAPWKSAETMRRNDDLYRFGVVVAHNMHPSQEGGGSCIFLHIARGPGAPTAGCTAMAAQDLRKVIMWLRPKARPVFVQLPQAAYERLRTPWALP